ncbi:MAG: hypothetical protein DRO40_10225 [Thermoprotei archaeon]|nr:MAG: hypothetical protein DRO40_10225 [Thermoprotei archaeon]
MTETKYTIQSTGNYLADALCSLGLFELALRIDPLLDAKCCIGRHEVLQLKSRLKKEDFKNRLLDELERLSKSNRIQQKLDFKVNTGDGCPRAYQVLQQKVVPKIESGIEEEAFKERIIKSTRRRREEYITCYLSLLPIYGKGLKVYDKSMSPASAELKPEVLAAYMTGLAFYTVQWEEREKDSDRRVHLAIVPPLGVSVNREYLLALRRIASLYSTEGFREYAKRMDGIPRISIPLAVLICFDISLLKFLASTAPPQILVFDVEVAKRGGETSRLYESYSTAPTLKFLAGLYENVHEVKEYVGSLVRT